ncbi:hypothetical protein GBA52_019489 [Prunus armeniaca]|nr:hypothetical protein GBA52_019489 [Prunus armeniaca]
MAEAYQKLSWMAFVVVPLLGCASCSSEGGKLATNREEKPNLFMEDGLHLPDSSRKFNFGILPTSIPIPPSRRHSRKTSSSPSLAFHLSRASNFGMQHSGSSFLLRNYCCVVICRDNKY